MADYAFRPRADGHTEVVEKREVVLGVFAEETHARAFYDLLSGGAVRWRPTPDPELLPPLLIEQVQEPKVAPVALVGAAVAPRPAEIDMEECRLCGREFRPSVCSPDLCSRCNR